MVFKGDELGKNSRRGLWGGKFEIFLILVMINCIILTGLLINVPNATAGPELDHIIIRDAPNGGGDPVGNRSYDLGDTDTFYAAGYNKSSGYMGDIDVGWSVTVKYIGTVTAYGNSTTFTPTNPGSTYITVTTDPTLEKGIGNTTGVINVFKHSIDYIVIHELGDDDWVEDRYYYPGQYDFFFAAGFNNTHLYQGSYAATWTSSDPNVSIIVSSETKPYKNEFRAIGTGNCTVTADFGGGITNTTGTLTVGPNIDYFTIRDGPNNMGSPVGNRTYHVGDNDTFYAAGYNKSSGYLGDIVVMWNIEPERLGNGTVYANSTTFNATGPGSGIIRVSLRSWTIRTGNQTGVITVFNNSIDKIIISDNFYGNGTWIGDRTHYVGDILLIVVAGYNNTHGYEGDFAVSLTSSDPNICRIEESIGYPRWHELYAMSVGNCTVTAEFGGGITNTTGTLTIGPKIDYVIIRDAPNGTGDVIDNRTYETFESDTFYAAGYNNTFGYQDDVDVYWVSEHEDVGRVHPEEGKMIYHSSSVTFEPIYNGSTWIEVFYYRMRYHPGYDWVYNKTGEIKVNSPPDITVDDSGGADYLTIQEAIDAANIGGKILVNEGIYNEHVNVYKRLKIIGESRSGTIIDGASSGTVVSITASDVILKTLTIQNGDYGVFIDKANNTEITQCLVKNYDYGIYNNYTMDGLIMLNEVTNGSYGIVTYEAGDDAVIWNTISYNTVCGAKDYNTERGRCFNWNIFRHNKIAYWYDPTKELTEMEFDGNLLEHNEIGVKVSDASTVRITNNTITDGDYGIYIENASPWLFANMIENNRIGIYCFLSNSTVESNNINNSDYGIYSRDSSPRLIKNMVIENKEPAIYVERADIIIIADNTADEIIIKNSTVKELSLINTEAIIINSTVLSLCYDPQSRLITKWFLRIRVEDPKGYIVDNATVRIQDIFGNENAVLLTDSDGWTDPIALTEFVLDVNGQTYHTPHMILVEKEGASCEETVTVNKDMNLLVTLKQSTPIVRGEFPWIILLVIGSVSAVGVGCLLGTEIGKLSLLSLFIPLYMKLKKENVLDHYNRGRVYQFIELNPGEHYNSIKKAFDMNSGALTYHLYVLEKAEKIKSRKDGIYKRFYPHNATVPQNNGGILTEIQKRIVDSIRDLPGATQKELASVLGLRQSTLSYQLTKLETKGVIRAARKGKHTCYYPKL
ncbi:MAG: right-handed parallel beta-helix repeat-containing protein [Thermoplasmata archaeon]|nr:MAG: right-handed parallel beta-helix repeat-containing protein [Thermoplasmata archaeon]